MGLSVVYFLKFFSREYSGMRGRILGKEFFGIHALMCNLDSECFPASFVMLAVPVPVCEC